MVDGAVTNNPVNRLPRKINTKRLLGRLSEGYGTPEEISLNDLAVALKPSLALPTGGVMQVGPTEHGFGFFIGGTMLAGEILGGIVFAHDIKFTNGPYVILSQVQAQASAVFHLVTGFPDTTVGTITFAANSKTGVLAWSGGSFTLTTGTQLRMNGPNPADVSLAYVSGTVAGAFV